MAAAVFWDWGSCHILHTTNLLVQHIFIKGTIAQTTLFITSSFLTVSFLNRGPPSNYPCIRSRLLLVETNSIKRYENIRYLQIFKNICICAYYATEAFSLPNRYRDELLRSIAMLMLRSHQDVCTHYKLHSLHSGFYAHSEKLTCYMGESVVRAEDLFTTYLWNIRCILADLFVIQYYCLNWRFRYAVKYYAGNLTELIVHYVIWSRLKFYTDIIIRKNSRGTCKCRVCNLFLPPVLERQSSKLSYHFRRVSLNNRFQVPLSKGLKTSLHLYHLLII